jgi:hypothetical protein
MYSFLDILLWLCYIGKFGKPVSAAAEFFVGFFKKAVFGRLGICLVWFSV